MRIFDAVNGLDDDLDNVDWCSSVDLMKTYAQQSRFDEDREETEKKMMVGDM